MASWALRKRVPNSALAVDAATSLRVVQVIWMAPLSLIRFLSTGKLPRKKQPPARLRAQGAERYKASEWVLIIILEAG